MSAIPAGSAPARTGALRIVGLGASAGGLEVLAEFLSHVPPDSGHAYVVVQHLDPTHKALLAGLLQRATPMPVLEATEGLHVAADAVYVIPPNAEMTLRDGALHLAPPTQPRGLRLPIDLLFSSLARDQGEDAIGVVLSGMGSDGTLGLQAIQSQGGLCVVQSPESAPFDSMPRSAIAAGCGDIIGAPRDLPERILRVTSPAPAAPSEESAPADEPGALAQILELLRQHSRHDLSQYKPSTLRRRVQRRVDVHGLADTAAYAQFVRLNPQELDLLFKELLIGVTSFFRDPAVWQELKTSVLPALLERCAPGAQLRAWVVGCSTGEEAYSLAMVFQEAVSQLPPGQACTLQIFASDLSADAIAAARRGRYPAKISNDVDAARLARFFVARRDGWQVAPLLREMVLFAQHDVIQDPPFTRLDLLCCRNLLIYFSTLLQRRLLPLFGYSLRAGGALMLGASETIGAARHQFRPVSPQSRLFWRSGPAAQVGALDFPLQPLRRSAGRPTQEHTVAPPSTQPANLQALAEQALLQALSPPAVLVNHQGDVVYIHGSIGRYLEPASGKANWNVHVMARPALRAQLAAALRQAVHEQQPVALHGLRLDDASAPTLDVMVKPLQEPAPLRGLVLLAFHEATPPARRRRKATPGAADGELADELQRWKTEAQALREEMQAQAEELQASNEELQSTNEELQSANEELTTSKEEAQSMNEELQTLNGELQTRLDDLALAQSDMQNLLNSTDIATLFLDNSLNVRRYTDQITRIIHMRDGDVGRPLTDLTSTLLYADLNEDAKQTLRSLSSTQKEITTTDGLWFQVRIKPYRTLADVIQGVVITFIDITAAKQLESRLRST